MNFQTFLVQTSLWIFLLPLVVITSPLLIFLLIWRHFINLLANIFNSSLEPLDSPGHLFSSLSPNNKEIGMMVTFALRVKGHIDVPKLRTHFSNTFLSFGKSNYETFYKYPVSFMGYSFAKKVKELDLEFHIKEVHLGDRDEKDFDKMFERFASKNKHLEVGGVPPWEILVVNNIVKSTPQERLKSVIFIKMDHTFADGYSMVHLIDTLCGNKSPYIVKDKSMSLRELMGIIWRAPLFYLQLLKLLKTRSGMESSLQAQNNPRPLRRISLTSTTTVDFRQIKSIRQQEKVRVIPILISLHAGALERSLLGLRASKQTKLPNYFGARYVLPIPNHPAVFQSKICNHAVLGYNKIPLQMSPWTRLHSVQKAFHLFLKNHLDDILIWDLKVINYYLPRWILRHKQKLTLDFVDSLEFSLSSLILSPEKYTILGNPVENFYFRVEIHPSSVFNGVIMYTLTHGNKMDICTVAVNNEIFKTQNDLDYHTKEVIPMELAYLEKHSLHPN